MMMTSKRNGLALLGLAYLLVTGCASQSMPDPSYSAVRPAPITPADRPDGAVIHVDRSVSLFEDYKARHVGDLLTVVLTESTNASKQASTSTGKDSSFQMPGPTIFGRPVTSGGAQILEMDIESAQEFDGEGASTQRNALNGSITVTVAEVLANGYLVVQGEKYLALNQGEEFIRIRGIVRPIDIRADNTIPSTLVADAQITYGGAGVIADANDMGWASKFFNRFWPF